jgi:hypothetical protein
MYEKNNDIYQGKWGGNFDEAKGHQWDSVNANFSSRKTI